MLAAALCMLSIARAKGVSVLVTQLRGDDLLVVNYTSNHAPRTLLRRRLLIDRSMSVASKLTLDVLAYRFLLTLSPARTKFALPRVVESGDTYLVAFDVFGMTGRLERTLSYRVGRSDFATGYFGWWDSSPCVVAGASGNEYHTYRGGSQGARLESWSRLPPSLQRLLELETGPDRPDTDAESAQWVHARVLLRTTQGGNFRDWWSVAEPLTGQWARYTMDRCQVTSAASRQIYLRPTSLPNWSNMRLLGGSKVLVRVLLGEDVKPEYRMVNSRNDLFFDSRIAQIDLAAGKKLFECEGIYCQVISPGDRPLGRRPSLALRQAE